MSTEQLQESIEKILDLIQTVNVPTMQLVSEVVFQGYMLRYLYAERLLQCTNPMGELKRIEAEVMEDVKSIESEDESELSARMSIHFGAIDAGENFFSLLEKNMKTEMERLQGQR